MIAYGLGSLEVGKHSGRWVLAVAAIPRVVELAWHVNFGNVSLNNATMSQ